MNRHEHKLGQRRVHPVAARSAHTGSPASSERGAIMRACEPFATADLPYGDRTVLGALG